MTKIKKKTRENARIRAELKTSLRALVRVMDFCSNLCVFTGAKSWVLPTDIFTVIDFKLLYMNGQFSLICEFVKKTF